MRIERANRIAVAARERPRIAAPIDRAACNDRVLPAAIMTTSIGGLIGAVSLALAVAAFAPEAAADPTDADPDLAARDADYAAGRQAAGNKDWTQAVQRFELALKRNPEHADLETDLGFAYRNLKQYDLAFKHYRRAIELDPRNRSAHEYIGEAYLMTGDLTSAEKHLKALQQICLLPCEELTDLERAIADYRKGK